MRKRRRSANRGPMHTQLIGASDELLVPGARHAYGCCWISGAASFLFFLFAQRAFALAHTRDSFLFLSSHALRIFENSKLGARLSLQRKARDRARQNGTNSSRSRDV